MIRTLYRQGWEAAKFFFKFLLPMQIHKWKEPKGIYLIMTPEHGNLGDHALAYSEIRMLKQLGIPYFEITGRQLDRLARLKRLNMMNGYPILFNGGGYLGTLWPESEYLTREVIRSNPDSKILILPNTIYYPETPEGRKETEKSAEIYNAHPDLWLYAREQTSFDTMRALYRNVKLVPDMVLSLDWEEKEATRRGCILSLRRDCEKTRTAKDEETLREAVAALFGENVAELDMVMDGMIQPQNRESALQEQFHRFRSAELVITDRLHGMIFAAISETPCIVIDSKSPKVRGCYEWIQDLGYICFADSPDQIPELYKTMPQSCRYTNAHLHQYYDMLKEDIVSRLAEGN